jgi:hypothetical protein
MENFKEKIEKIAKLRDDVDNHIWNVFYRYIKIKKILFSCPNSWHVNDDNICFQGEDGCMSCYDPMSICIPLEFFIDEDALDKLEKEIGEIENRKELIKRNIIKNDELQQLKRLKEKYEGTE